VYNTLRKAPKNFEAGIKMYAGQKPDDQKEQGSDSKATSDAADQDQKWKPYFGLFG
jgi:hypothetical protein